MSGSKARVHTKASDVYSGFACDYSFSRFRIVLKFSVKWSLHSVSNCCMLKLYSSRTSRAVRGCSFCCFLLKIVPNIDYFGLLVYSSWVFCVFIISSFRFSTCSVVLIRLSTKSLIVSLRTWLKFGEFCKFGKIWLDSKIGGDTEMLLVLLFFLLNVWYRPYDRGWVSTPLSVSYFYIIYFIFKLIDNFK